MAFSLSDIPRAKAIKTKNAMDKRDVIAKCFIVIKNQNLITEEIREALSVYLTERLKNMSNTNLSVDLLKSNITELLEFCCNKKLEDISEEDVIDNEEQILQQIMWCIEYKNTKRLIFDESDYKYIGKSSKELGKSKVFTKEVDIHEYFRLRSKYYG